jgi:hypothetical protein
MLEGSFSQSNYGIVTSARIWLLPRPPVIRAWAFSFPDDGDLPEIIDIVRGFEATNFVPTLIKVTRRLRVRHRGDLSRPRARRRGTERHSAARARA